MFTDFATPINIASISQDEGYKQGQTGWLIEADNDVEAADMVIVGCDEWRGAASRQQPGSADAIRHQLYKLFFWHTDVRIADIGNVHAGSSLTDSYAALKTVVKELMQAGKKVLVIGGSHDNTLAQYQAFADDNKIIEATIVDALLDIDHESPAPIENFLLDMLTCEPNYIRHYNHLAFQSYFVHPRLLETIDKLRFDCFRVGKVKEAIDEMEPVIRSSSLLSIDMNALAHAYAPANSLSPNGLNGIEACKLMQYAGMSQPLQTVGIYGFDPARDNTGLTAMQIAHMIWYYIDGLQRQKHEAPLDELNSFNEYHTICAEVDTLFLQSKRTGRWWMQMPDTKFIACSYTDYLTASNNDLPERWLRAQERM